jgi:HK97 gp10 family phage protein
MAPMRFSWDLKGFDEYLEALVKSGEDVDAAAQEALAAGAPILLEGMRKRAPELTGELIDHLTISGPHQVNNDHFVYVGLTKTKEVSKELAIYATVQEFGSAHTPAHPYIRPAIASEGRRAMAAIVEVFKKKLGLE